MAGLRETFGRARDVAREALYAAYERKLMSEQHRWRKPHHLGVVMDGNRRFAREAGADSVVVGHAAGADKLEEVLDWCEEVEIPVMTVWIFSLDNFGRAEDEVEGLMNLFEKKFLELVTSQKIHKNGIRICSIGRIDALPRKVQRAIRAAEAATAGYDRRILNVGVAYGGREEIVDAVRAHLAQAAAEGRSLAEVATHFDAADVERHLYTAHVNDPDLIIRTSGEVRLSGFLLWQSAHAEYYFTDAFWPAFRKIEFLRALRSYDLRQRRYGK